MKKQKFNFYEMMCTRLKRPVKYNPAESETYKALKEEELGEKVQEVTVPPQSKVFTPNKTAPPKVKLP